MFLSDEDGQLIDDASYPRVLFLMHKWFMTSNELATQFLQLYPLYGIALTLYGIALKGQSLIQKHHFYGSNKKMYT